MDQHLLKQDYGIIQTPGFLRSSMRQPFDCSWVIDVPCPNGLCGMTIYFDALNITNTDLITVSFIDYKERLFKNDSSVLQ